MDSHNSAGCYLIRFNAHHSLELLVIYRRWADGKEAFVVPKGHIENGESLEQAAIRETTEETGYTNIQIVKPLGSRTYKLDLNGGIEKTDHFFLAILKSEERKNQTLTKGESESGFVIQWKKLEDAFNLLTWENNKEYLSIINEYIRQRV